MKKSIKSATKFFRVIYSSMRTKQRRQAICLSPLLARWEGFAPLAARPGAQPAGLVQFAYEDGFNGTPKRKPLIRMISSCAMAAESSCKQELLAHVGRSCSRLHPRIPLKYNNTNSGGQMPAAVRGAVRGIRTLATCNSTTPLAGELYFCLSTQNIG